MSFNTWLYNCCLQHRDRQQVPFGWQNDAAYQRAESLHPLPEHRSPFSPPHASLSKDAFTTFLPISLFTSIHFCSFHTWWNSTLHASVYFCHFFFMHSMQSSLFLHWVRLEEIREQQGNSRVTHQLWNISMSTRQWKRRKSVTRGRWQKDECNRQKRWCCADR